MINARFAEKLHCVDFRVSDFLVAPPYKQVKAADVNVQQRQEALVTIEMRKLYHLIDNHIANGLWVQKYSKLKMYKTSLFLCFNMRIIATYLSIYRYTLCELLINALVSESAAVHKHPLVFYHFVVNNLKK